MRVTAAPVVPLDLLCASGTSYFGRPRTPYVPGVQGVGVVERSESLAAGSRVWFATSAGMAPGDGSLAELCSVADVDVVPLEADVSDPVAAAIGLSGVAAWMALSWRGALQPGETVLVLGGGGAVGQAGIGAARALGAGRIVAVARSEEAQRRALTPARTSSFPSTATSTSSPPASRRPPRAAPTSCSTRSSASPPRRPPECSTHGGRLVNLGGAAGDEARSRPRCCAGARR